MKYLGCAYYPEYWGPERYEIDARLMKEAGINIARIGEFAWSRMEPEEGCYTLDWLHEVIDMLARYGIDVMVCTPTATPPAWLTFDYPETLVVQADGRRAEHGSRRHYCTTSDTYRLFSAQITDVLSQEISRHPNIVAWQLDNEFGPEMSWCHCENCQTHFRGWLKERYGSIPELNRRWMTGFWSNDYTHWQQVRLSNIPFNAYSARNLDSKRFWSEMVVDFAQSQTRIIRQNHPEALVTTNGMGPIYSPVNYYELFSDLDVACDDLYFDISTMDADVVAMNVYRSIKPDKAYWLTETGSGALDPNRPPKDDQFRAWAWSSLAHGAEAHMIFRWRTALSGHEQELQGILEHSGEPRHRYQAVQRCFIELRDLWPQLKDLPFPKAPVAIIQDYHTYWAYESSRVFKLVDYAGLIYRIHKMLYDANIVTDFIPPGRDLTRYKMVILPSTVMISSEFAVQLSTFVENGGLLLGMGQVGMRDTNDNYLPYAGPDHLQDLLGVQIEGGMYLNSHVGPDEALISPRSKIRRVNLPLQGMLDSRDVGGNAQMWAADLTLRGGESLLNFSSDTYKGQPAIVEKTTGAGKSVYLGAIQVSDALFCQIMDYVIGLANIQKGLVVPEYVELIQRGDVIFIINHRDEAVRVELGLDGTPILGDFAAGVADLQPFGVCVIYTTK